MTLWWALPRIIIFAALLASKKWFWLGALLVWMLLDTLAWIGSDKE